MKSATYPLASGIKGHTVWQKALFRSKALRDIAAHGKFDIRSIALLIALYGANGRGCFASEETIASQIGCHRNVIGKYRKQLIELGWFTVVSRDGGYTRQGLVLDIALPESPVDDPWAD